MHRYEELLEKIREIGPVDRDEIDKEVKTLSAKIETLSIRVREESEWVHARKILDEMMVIADRLRELDSLNKAMILYEMEQTQQNIWKKLLNLFKN